MQVPHVLFISLTNDTGCERLPIEFIRYGIDCACLSPPKSQCRNVSGLTHFHLPAHRGVWLAALACSRALQQAVDAFAPDLLVPLDDLAAYLLRGLCGSGRIPVALTSLIERSTGAVRGHHAARWRVALMDEAKAAGVPVPNYRAFHNVDSLLKEAGTLEYPVVVKEENSCGGRGVVIAHDLARLRQAFMPSRRSISSSPAFKHLRSRARQFMWGLAGVPTGLWRSILLQQLVEGQTALCTVVVEKGRILESLCFVTELNHPRPTGASTIVRFITHERMEKYAARLVRHLSYSGFVSFDFILSPDEKDATLIEMNARPVGTVHLGQRFGRDLCGASLQLLGEALSSPPQTKPLETRMVALFPKELERDPDSFANGVPIGLFHDVPWSERAVIESHGRRLARMHPTRSSEIWRQISAKGD